MPIGTIFDATAAQHQRAVRRYSFDARTRGL